jgi:CBS domain-containing protein
MKIKEIMTKNVEALRPDDTIQKAAQKMRDRNVGFLPILEEGDLVGVVTDRDLVVRTLADGTKSKTMIGRDVPTSPGLYCFDDQDTDSAVRLMQTHQIRRLVVLDHDNGKVVGVVSLGDLASHIPPETTGEAFQEITRGFVKAH